MEVNLKRHLTESPRLDLDGRCSGMDERSPWLDIQSPYPGHKLHPGCLDAFGWMERMCYIQEPWTGCLGGSLDLCHEQAPRWIAGS